MSIAAQLFQLQEVELEIEAKETSIKKASEELGESKALQEARTKLAEAKKRGEELASRQRSMEWEIEDVSGKLRKVESDLYSGRIHIPKELSSMQQEAAALKARQTQLEDSDLDIMEQAEGARAEALGKQIASEKALVAELAGRQQELSRGIESSALSLYRTLRNQKGVAVARVEQGICRGCRISLPASELQRARSGSLVQCSSCSRILYLP
jgi:predicted  nucleic acid-binding Zn-ribbon protein